MIVKAIVKSYSAGDPEGKGRVLIETPTIWEGSTAGTNWVPVLNNLPLNEGDVVFVWFEGNDTQNPLIIGRCRDNNFSPSAEVPGNFSVLWDSVQDGGNTWSIAYTAGDELWIENSAGAVLGVAANGIQLHSGANGGLININILRGFITAVAQDLALLGGGVNVSQWLARDYATIEDTSVLH